MDRLRSKNAAGVVADEAESGMPCRSIMEIPVTVHELLTSTAVAFVSTLGKRDEPQVTPLWFLWDGESVRITLFDGRQKLRNLRRDSRGTNLSALAAVATGVSTALPVAGCPRAGEPRPLPRHAHLSPSRLPRSRCGPHARRTYPDATPYARPAAGPPDTQDLSMVVDRPRLTRR